MDSSSLCLPVRVPHDVVLMMSQCHTCMFVKCVVISMGRSREAYVHVCIHPVYNHSVYACIILYMYINNSLIA